MLILFISQCIENWGGRNTKKGWCGLYDWKCSWKLSYLKWLDHCVLYRHIWKYEHDIIDIRKSLIEIWFKHIIDIDVKAIHVARRLTAIQLYPRTTTKQDVHFTKAMHPKCNLIAIIKPQQNQPIKKGRFHNLQQLSNNSRCKTLRDNKHLGR
jgi:hypothetical protein